MLIKEAAILNFKFGVGEVPPTYWLKIPTLGMCLCDDVGRIDTFKRRFEHLVENISDIFSRFYSQCFYAFVFVIVLFLIIYCYISRHFSTLLWVNWFTKLTTATFLHFGTLFWLGTCHFLKANLSNKSLWKKINKLPHQILGIKNRFEGGGINMSTDGRDMAHDFLCAHVNLNVWIVCKATDHRVIQQQVHRACPIQLATIVKISFSTLLLVMLADASVPTFKIPKRLSTSALVLQAHILHSHDFILLRENVTTSS